MADSAGRKTGGRAKGVPNKDNELKSWVRDLLGNNKNKMEEELKKLKGMAYTSTYISLMEYAVPKLARVDVKSENTNEHNITINYNKTKEKK